MSRPRKIRDREQRLADGDPAGNRAQRRAPTAHGCPARGCDRVVPNRLLACPKHWFQLPATLRQDITRTASLNLLHPERRAALAAASQIWGTTPEGSTST